MKHIALALSALMLLSACNTMQGLGKDVRNLGTNIEKSADHDQN